MIEEWKSAWGFSRYFVSNLGRIREGLSNTFVIAEPMGDGHYWVSLTDNQGRQCARKVSRIVADTFLPTSIGVYGYSQVVHRDGDTRNNCADNLQRVYEARKSRATISIEFDQKKGRKAEEFAEKVKALEEKVKKGELKVSKMTPKSGKTASKPVWIVGTLIVCPSIGMLSRELDMDRNTMAAVMKRKEKSYNGFFFEFVEKK